MKKLFMFIFVILLFLAVGYSAGFCMGPPMGQERIALESDTNATVVAIEKAATNNLVVVGISCEKSHDYIAVCGDSANYIYLSNGSVDNSQAMSGVCRCKSPMELNKLINRIGAGEYIF